MLHTTYIDRLTITCTRIERDPPASFVAWDSMPALQRIDVVDLPQLSSIWAAIAASGPCYEILVGHRPRDDCAFRCRRVAYTRRLAVDSVGPAAWKIRHRGRRIRFLADQRPKERFAQAKASRRHLGTAEPMVRKRSACRFFHSRQLQRTLLTRHPERGHVLPASWIDDDSILAQSDAEAQWNRKDAKSGALDLLFVGRLIPEKGIVQLLEALELSQTAPGKVRFDILGHGRPDDGVRSLGGKIERQGGHQILGYVDYGPKFFDQLAAYDVIVVPSLSNEQPRIAFDAFARAIPVLGYATEGLASCVKNDITGKLCPVGVRELATLIDWAFANRTQLREMGMRGLGVARSYTHREMHQSRSRILTACIDASIQNSPRKRRAGWYLANKIWTE